MSFTKFLKILTILLFYTLIPLKVGAAILYFEPSSGEYQPGDTFIVEMRIDTEEECINSVKTDLEFSQDILKAIDFSRGDSILTLWVRPPEINQVSGLISFVGGIPGGYCGRIPGDPGASNLLGKIIFRIPGLIVGEAKEYLAEVKFLDTSQVFLNDGLGTKAKITTQGAIFEIFTKAEPSKDEWREEIKGDTIPPESFTIEIHQEPAIFEGKYFIIFSTTDKQTGLDYYEVKEGRRNWKKATSPYLLADQELQDIIKVKAVDGAGNERIAEYIPASKPFPYWLIILILVGLGAIIWLWTKYTKKSKKGKKTG